MPYVTSVERLGLERGRKEGLRKGLKKGRQEGQREGIELDLETTFDVVDAHLLEEIRGLKDVGKLRIIARALKKAKTLNQIRPLLDS